MILTGSTVLALILGWVWWRYDVAKADERRRAAEDRAAEVLRRDRARLGKL